MDWHHPIWQLASDALGQQVPGSISVDRDLTALAGEGKIVVGLIIFVIIIVIQFVVITKGATRISEVAARFALDGMPGKQMAIDADLNAGIIDEREAQRRREEITQQADFFGAMDGASKFVRGDAVAGIIITIINILGGLIIGMAESFGGFYVSTDYKDIIAFVLLVVILSIRPQGLFAGKAA